VSFLGSSHPCGVLWLFYSSAFLSAIMFSAASYASVSYHRPLLVLALVTALAAAFFLVLFLRSRDERGRQINYRALTFALLARSASRSLSAWRSNLDFIPCPGSGFLQ